MVSRMRPVRCEIASTPSRFPGRRKLAPGSVVCFRHLLLDRDGDPADVAAVRTGGGVSFAHRLAVNRAAVEAADEISLVLSPLGLHTGTDARGARKLRSSPLTAARPPASPRRPGGSAPPAPPRSRTPARRAAGARARARAAARRDPGGSQADAPRRAAPAR